MTHDESLFRVAEALTVKDMKIAQLEASVTDLIGVVRAMVSLAQPISLPTFLHVQQAIKKAQQAKDAA